MRITLFVIIFIFLQAVSCKDSDKVSDEEKIQIVEQILGEYYSEIENVKTINTLMVFCDTEHWISLSNNRSALYEKQGKIWPLPPSSDTIIFFGENLKMLGFPGNEEFSINNKCSSPLTLNLNHSDLITWEEIKSRQYKGPFQMLSIPVFSNNNSKLILYHKRFTTKMEFTINLFERNENGWTIMKSASLIGS